MKALIVSAESVPFAKVGGLADVVGSLPRALRHEGVDARVLMPGYAFIDHQRHGITHLFQFKFEHRNGVSDIDVYTCIVDGVPFYLIQSWPYFGQDSSVYTTWEWDANRFIFFNQVSLSLAWHLKERLGWFPDIFHVNDWHTSLIPFLIANNRDKPFWRDVASVISIHNIAYQGDHMGAQMWAAGIAAREHPMLQQDYLSDNLLAIGIVYSDMISTVSPRYAQEIQHSFAGYQLAPLVRSRVDDLVGILNGLDVDTWNPETDRYLVMNYSAENFEEQRIYNKRHLQAFTRLPIRDDVPIMGVVSRLTWQKGFDFAVPALWRLLAEEDVQFVVLGTGEPEIEQQMGHLCRHFHEKAKAFLHFDAALSQQIYAGCDIFLMPSHFEPCGIGQMLAMRYGALPLVRETGGLADTVENYDNADGERGAGFVFQAEDAEALLGTMRWALHTYRNQPQAWRRMQRRAMLSDFSWDMSARSYTKLYEKAIVKHKEGAH